MNWPPTGISLSLALSSRTRARARAHTHTLYVLKRVVTDTALQVLMFQVVSVTSVTCYVIDPTYIYL